MRLAGIFPRLFSPATAVLKAAADAGRFGRISLVEAAIKWWRSQEYYDSGTSKMQSPPFERAVHRQWMAGRPGERLHL